MTNLDTNPVKYQKLTSSQNNLIKSLKKLALKKYRIASGQFAVENLTIIYDALVSGHHFDTLFVTREFILKHPNKIEYLQAHSKCKNYYLIDEKINKHYSQLDTPSGITAVYKIKNRELTDTSVIYLDRVSDPGNLGTIMRSALAFGFLNIVLNKSCADIYNYKTINAVRDAIFKLNILVDKDDAWLDNNTLPIYITSAHTGQALSKFKPDPVFCLVLGNESHGTSRKITDKAVIALKIEMSQQIESLNVASAAGILFYELRKMI